MMKKQWVAVAVVVASPGLLLAVSVDDREPVAEPINRISEELERLNTLPALAEVEGSQKESVERQRKGLREVRAELAAGRPYWALAQLEQPYVNLERFSFVASRSAIEEGDLAALRRESDELSSRISQGEAELFGPGIDDLPVAFRAVAESVWQRTRPTQHAALAYGETDRVRSGLYYLGNARANLDFVLFCRALGPASRATPIVPDLAEAISALDLEIVAAYDPGSAADYGVYGPFVLLNVAIKKARELDAAEHRFGALYQYLDARMRLEVIRDVGPPADTETLHRRADEWRVRLRHDEIDHSLGELFWEYAESVLAGEAPTEEDLKRATVIFEYVLPDYFHHIEDPKA